MKVHRNFGSKKCLDLTCHNLIWIELTCLDWTWPVITWLDLPKFDLSRLNLSQLDLLWLNLAGFDLPGHDLNIFRSQKSSRKLGSPSQIILKITNYLYSVDNGSLVLVLATWEREPNSWAKGSQVVGFPSQNISTQVTREHLACSG